MKNFRNLSLKVGVGLVLGIGSLVVTGSTAHADTPCPPYDFADERDCQADADTTKGEGVVTCYPAPIQAVGYRCYDTDGSCYAESNYKKTTFNNRCFTSKTTYYDCTSVIYEYIAHCVEV